VSVPSKVVKFELERRYDAEVCSGAADCPEQILVLALAGSDQPAVRRDKFHFAQAIDREAVLALQAAHSAAKRQATHAGMRDDTDRAD